MKYVSNFVRLIAFACMYMFASMQVVFADDTEIFFTPPSAAVAEKPNIMFIIDSSGSMGWGVSGTTDSRMEVVQDVMDEVLTNITNVNAGLMRFNNGSPGPIIFPVLDIDEEATPTAFQTVFAGANDGTQEALLGTIDLTGNSLEFNGPNKVVGIRFEDLNIPQGATIVSANVIFTAKGNTTGAADVTITGEKVDSAAFLNPVVAGEFSIRDAANPTTAFETWTMDNWVDGDIYSTTDVSGVIEEITDQSGWCGGNDLMLFFTSLTGTSRVAYSKDGVDNLPAVDPDDPASVFAPRIKIEYSQTFVGGANKCMANEAVSQVSVQGDDFEIKQDGTTVSSSSSDLEFYLDGSNAQKGVGMVFNNIKVPQGASISYAYLSFTADEDSVGTSDVNIELVNSDTVSSPTTDFARLLLHNAPATAAVPWSIADNWVTGNLYRSEDISSIVSTVTSRAGWALDNNMAVFIRGVSGRHVADSFSGNAPKLHIGFEGVWEPGVNTIRDDLKSAVAALTPSGGTPISGTYAEAGAYFKGDSVFYGASRNSNRFSRVSHELSYSASGTVLRATGCTDANLDASACETETITGAPKYESPIVESCQQTHIVYLTDGSSNSHLSSTNAVYSSWSNGGTCSSSNGGNDCSVKMAAWLNTNDVSPVSGKQVITTHMIGFGPGADPDLMQDMATAGGGGYYSPQDRAELVNDISKILDGIASVNSTFVTAGVTVNQYNRVTNNDERYFSLFTPVNKESWPGNIKRYKLVAGELVDANNALAIDPVSSEFDSTAKSFWSASADGNDVEKGGAAEQLGLGRRVYSNISSNNLVSDGANALRQTNGSITAALLGGVTTQRRDSILYWVSGFDVNDSAYDPADSSSLASTPTRKNIGDPLHSQPALLQYNDASGNLLSTRIYVGTNHGFLHSFNADNGNENWAFVPKDLLPKLDTVITNATTTGHSYGLDGTVSLYLNDGNANGAVDPGEKVYLYVGQRRGGSSYYAIDISDPDSPKFMFQITNTGDYADLGQTWSKPIVAKMNLSGVNSDQLVMIFGGGYDAAQDTAGTSANTDTIGDNLYIADAYTGALLWNAKGDALAHGGLAGPVSSMNSVPSDVSAFDLAGDGLVDHIYVTDTKAQVFRFDADNSAQTIKGGRIAQLQDVGGAANNRRFFYSADTALIRQVGESFIAVSIGSGYRSHPLDLTVDDAFYVLKDKGVLKGVFDMDAVLSDLQDVTSLVDADNNGVSDAVEILDDPTSLRKGWYLDLSSTSGEKVLARSVTFNNAVLFTTYIPPSGVASACEAAAGGGRLYALNILNGNPYLDTNTDGSLTESDRLFELQTPGIAPQVDIQITETGPIVSVGRKFFKDIVPRTTDGILGYKWKKVN